MTQRRNSEATEMVDRLLKKLPRCSAARSLAEAGSLLRRQGKLAEAEVLLGPALMTHAKDSGILCAWAALMATRGRLGEAAKAYRKALKLRPDRLQIVFSLSQTLARQGRTADMLRLLKKASRGQLAPGADIQTLLNRLHLELFQFDFERAASTSERILNSTRSYRTIGMLCTPFFMEEFDFISLPPGYKRRALAALNRYVARRPRSPWGYFYRDVLADTMGVRKDGSDIAKIASFPAARYGWMRCRVGHYHLLVRRDFSAAAAELSVAVSGSEPGDWVAQCLLGETYLCSGRRDDARAAMDGAVKLAPEGFRGEALAWKGELLLWMGEYEQALDILEESLRLNARFANGWKGGALVKLGRYGEALESLDRATALTPHDAESRTWRAEALYRLGRFREARREVDDTLTRYERYGGFHLYAIRGLALGALEDFKYMRKNFLNLPTDVADYVSAKIGLTNKDSDESIKRIFEAVLDLSLGVRRGSYENSAWMR